MKGKMLYTLGLFLVIFSVVFVDCLFAAQPGSDGLVGVIVKFDDAPLAAYKGGIQGLQATSREITRASKLDVKSGASKAYLSYLNGKMNTFEAVIRASIPESRVVHRYPVVFGGISLRVPADKVDVLSKIPGVKAVYPDRIQKPDTNRSPYFIKADKLWEKLGGQGSAGEGIIVGIVDTGIWPEHPSFTDPDLSGKAYTAPAGWRGLCVPPLDTSTPITCTNKLIGARLFLDTYKADNGGLPAGEFDSARDAIGHGTHVASTAAGNGGVTGSILGSDLGLVSGIAPRAHVAMYKACAPLGCYDTDLVAAINQAVADGVDVINYSIGPTSVFLEDPYVSVDDLAFLDAYRAGVFVATSAGNSGSSPNTVNHLGGWTTTVAASTIDHYPKSTLTLKANGGKTLTLKGATMSPGIVEFKPVVYAGDFGDEFCQDPFLPGTFSGEIVMCLRGGDRVLKSLNVMNGGGSGMILHNWFYDGWALNNFWVPTISLLHKDGEKLFAFLNSSSGETAKFSAPVYKPAQGDIVAAFSSRGGPGQTYGVSKPDIAAPGVDILAGMTPAPAEGEGRPGDLFTLMSGTSMASPHIAGAAALLKDLNPTWTPGKIKSALMTTAQTVGVVTEEDGAAAGPFDEGSGRINLKKAVNPGLTFEALGDDFVAHQDDLWNVNYPSIYVPAMGDVITITRTAHSELSKKSTWSLSVKKPSDLKINVPPSIKVSAGGVAPFTIIINAAAVPAGEVRQGTIYLKYDTYNVHIPVTIVKGP